MSQRSGLFNCVFCKGKNDAEAEGHFPTSPGGQLMKKSQQTAPFHWGYEASNGPDIWSKHFSAASGMEQSPIDIDVSQVNRSNEEMAVEVNYLPSKVTVVNNGHAVQWTPEDAGHIVIKGKKYNLVQFHHHCPSEHTFSGNVYPIEVHFVHQHKESGELAVLGHLFELGEMNELIANITTMKPPSKADGEINAGIVDFSKICLTGNYVHYKGSLTTPPCSEGVIWYVCTTLSKISDKQVEWFRACVPHDTARPIMPLNGRDLCTVISS